MAASSVDSRVEKLGRMMVDSTVESMEYYLVDYLVSK